MKEGWELYKIHILISVSTAWFSFISNHQYLLLVCGGHRSLHPLCSTLLSLVSLDGPNLNIMTEFTITFDLATSS